MLLRAGETRHSRAEAGRVIVTLPTGASEHVPLCKFVTEQALMNVLENDETLAAGLTTGGLSLNLAKAFDNIDREVM